VNYAKGNYIQNYAQWQSATMPGKFDGMSCTAMFEDKSNGVTSTIGVANYVGSDSLTVASGVTGIWSDIGTRATEYNIFERETDSAKLAEYYGRTYTKNVEASQKCGANAMFYYGTDGEATPGFE
jgi:hypothetical protein